VLTIGDEPENKANRASLAIPLSGKASPPPLNLEPTTPRQTPLLGYPTAELVEPTINSGSQISKSSQGDSRTQQLKTSLPLSPTAGPILTDEAIGNNMKVDLEVSRNQTIVSSRETWRSFTQGNAQPGQETETLHVNQPPENSVIKTHPVRLSSCYRRVFANATPCPLIGGFAPYFCLSGLGDIASCHQRYASPNTSTLPPAWRIDSLERTR
jgi:hypothetical protein